MVRLGIALLLFGLVSGGCAGQERADRPSTVVLAYERDRAVWVVDEAWRQRRIAAGESPDWSPDGKRLALWRANRLIVRQLGTGRERKVFEARAKLNEFLPEVDWAPRGEVIALVTPVYDEFYRAAAPALATVDVRSGAVTQVDVPRLTDPRYDWSPDGRRLVYSACRLVGPASHHEAHCELTLYRVGERDRRILRENLASTDPLWAPDGSAIALDTQLRTSNREGAFVEGSAGLYVLELDTDEMTRVVPGLVRDFAWSPDSSSLVYTRDKQSLAPDDVLRVVGRTGTGDRVLRSTRGTYYSDISWSRDRNEIALGALESRSFAARGLDVIDARTGRIVRRVVARGDGVASPRWRPGATP